MNTEVDLRNHLESFGIQHFASDEYFEWGAVTLGARMAKEVNKLRKPLTRGSPTREQLRRFYDFIAKEGVAPVVHSMRADAIRVSGVAIAEAIAGATSVLDVGCSIGYLSTYYALLTPARKVLGWDWSVRTIRSAIELARTRAIGNVAYEVGDIEDSHPQGSFEAVVSAQTFYMLRKRVCALRNAAACLAEGGKIVCVEAIGTSQEAQRFLSDASEAGLSLSSFSAHYSSDLGGREAYPMFVFENGGSSIEVDLDREFDLMIRCVNAEID